MYTEPLSPTTDDSRRVKYWPNEPNSTTWSPGLMPEMRQQFGRLAVGIARGVGRGAVRLISRP